MAVHSPAIARTMHKADMVIDGGIVGVERHVADDEGQAPLADLAHEIGRELQCDGLLITWCDGGSDTVRLFADGACKPRSEIEGDMLAMAQTTARQPGAGPRSHWRLRGADDTGGMLTTTIPSDDGVVTVTTVFRRIGASTRMQASEAAARLLPLIQPFFRIWTMRYKAAARMRNLAAVVNNSDVATLLVGSGGELLFANPAANHLLSMSDGLRRKGGIVTGAGFGDTLRLHAAIEEAALPDTSRTSAMPLVALKRRTGRPLMASVVASGDPAASGGGCVAVIYVVDPDKDLRSVLGPACRLYELSPVEARLACLLANGLCLGDAAREMRVQESTARGYLKQVFLKTETNRQVELVRLMLASAVHR